MELNDYVCLQVELCAERGTRILNHNLEEVTLFDFLRSSMSAPGGLRMKISRFSIGFSQRLARADGKRSGLEFKVTVLNKL